jgi:hypothetical protein
VHRWSVFSQDHAAIFSFLALSVKQLSQLTFYVMYELRVSFQTIKFLHISFSLSQDHVAIFSFKLFMFLFKYRFKQRSIEHGFAFLVPSRVPSRRSGNVVPNYHGSRSKLIWDVLKLYTHRSKAFWKSVYHVPRPRTSSRRTGNGGDREQEVQKLLRFNLSQHCKIIWNKLIVSCFVCHFIDIIRRYIKIFSA